MAACSEGTAGQQSSHSRLFLLACMRCILACELIGSTYELASGSRIPTRLPTPHPLRLPPVQAALQQPKATAQLNAHATWHSPRQRAGQALQATPACGCLGLQLTAERRGRPCSPPGPNFAPIRCHRWVAEPLAAATPLLPLLPLPPTIGAFPSTHASPPCCRCGPAAGRSGELPGAAGVPAGRPRGAGLLAPPACLGGAASRRRAHQCQAGPVYATDRKRVGAWHGQGAWRCSRPLAACSVGSHARLVAAMQPWYPGRLRRPVRALTSSGSHGLLVPRLRLPACSARRPNHGLHGKGELQWWALSVKPGREKQVRGLLHPWLSTGVGWCMKLWWDMEPGIDEASRDCSAANTTGIRVFNLRLTHDATSTAPSSCQRKKPPCQPHLCSQTARRQSTPPPPSLAGC